MGFIIGKIMLRTSRTRELFFAIIISHWICETSTFFVLVQ